MGGSVCLSQCLLQVEACNGGESEVVPHASPLQNGGPLRRGSITSFKGGGGMNAVANGRLYCQVVMVNILCIILEGSNARGCIDQL